MTTNKGTCKICGEQIEKNGLGVFAMEEHLEEKHPREYKFYSKFWDRIIKIEDLIDSLKNFLRDTHYKIEYETLKRKKEVLNSICKGEGLAEVR